MKTLSDADVCVVGLGYVGLTLAVTLAEVGYRTIGFDHVPEVVRRLRSGRAHIFEPGVDEVLKRRLGKNLFIVDRLPEKFRGVTVICVSTPVGPNKKPDLRNLESATLNVARSARPGSLIVVRSTVPVGTTRRVVLPRLKKPVRLAFCPERTIQGLALRELRDLPQVVGGLDEASARLAASFWGRVTKKINLVGSLEAAEMVKLVNNTHTDLLYSFGNEVAAMAHRFGVDPLEVIGAANADYPRPKVARPGFVGGPCLTKDPYLLINSGRLGPSIPRLVATARATNEGLPAVVARHFRDLFKKIVKKTHGAPVLVCGFAYKGWPVTDDVRGGQTQEILEVLKTLSPQLRGHDYRVSSRVMASWGADPVVNLEQGFRGARAVLFVNEHPEYRRLPLRSLLRLMKRPALVYDCWRMFKAKDVESVPGVRYAGIGYG